MTGGRVWFECVGLLERGFTMATRARCSGGAQEREASLEKPPRTFDQGPVEPHLGGGGGWGCGQTRTKQAGWGQPGGLEEQGELGLAMLSVGQPGPGQH